MVSLGKYGLWTLLAAALVVLPQLLETYYVHLGVMICLAAMLAISLNIVCGYTGFLSLGHAAFFAVGAYSEALLTTKMGWNFWAAVLMGGVLSLGFGVLLAVPAMKTRSHYFTVITLAFQFITSLVLINWTPVTGGNSGITNIARPSIVGFTFSTAAQYFYLMLVVLAITVFLTNRIVHSRIGRSFVAVRENEDGARSLGVDNARVKLMSFMISAFIASVAGSFYSPYMRYINPDAFAFNLSMNTLVMVVVGGLGSITGSIIGAAVVYLLPEALRFLQSYYLILYGLLVIVVVTVMPDGLAGLLKPEWWRQTGRRFRGMAQPSPRPSQGEAGR